MAHESPNPAPAPQADAPHVPDVQARLADGRFILKSWFYGRDEEIDVAHCALLARQHALYVGPPGTAKSLLVRCVVSQLSGVVYRERLLSSQTVEEHLFGHLDLLALQQSRLEYIVDASCVPAHVCFIDEIFKASGGLLNSALSYLNERLVLRGGQRFQSPLISCFGASNEFGEDESVAALEDRFLLRCWVGYIPERADFVCYLQSATNGGARPPVLPAVSLDELAAAQSACDALAIDPTVYSILADLRESLAGMGIRPSDRRWRACLSVLRAWAWLEGDPDVGAEHVVVLRHVLWSRPEEKPIVEQALAQIDKGIVCEISAICTKALRRYADLRAACDSDGSWFSTGARAAYISECTSLMAELQEAAEQIKSRYGSNIPQRARDRAKAYLTELRDAFVQCRTDASLGL